MNKIITLILFFLNSSLFCQDNIYQFSQKEYYILDYPINIRAQPNLRGEVIGKLNLNDKITILQMTDNIQYIDGIYSYWYKIKYNEVTGYIFGGYIAVNRLVCDIDDNGIDDYIFFRFSSFDGSNFIIDSYQDIFIYINNTRIPTKTIFRDSQEHHFWMWCELNRYSYSVGIYISFGLFYSQGDGSPDEAYYFKVYGDGNIMFDYKESNLGIGL